jgi:cellulose synthase/poly-beta-1,6-N-acetylglucosamine synthase-like glycosyltransferase
LFSAVRDFFSFLVRKSPVYIPAREGHAMVDAGLFYKRRKYITHTTLQVYQSAVEVFDMPVVTAMVIIASVFSVAFFVSPLFFVQSLIFLLSCIYLIDVCFNLFLVFKTLQRVPELSFTQKEIMAIEENRLPVYSILCPLYKEANMLPQFIEGLEKLDYPKEKLDVIILLESDDTDSIVAFRKMSVPKYIRLVVVPDSFPKTKPKACNYGLAFARGEYTVIYDAEDIPDPVQLKKAYLGFTKYGDQIGCLQAKLNYYNANQNLLTKFFTIEYSLWFDLILTSLHALRTIIPLGGTSNHFRTEDLRKMHAWDPFNVTEDADLGLRLFKLGYQTAILDSVTLEEGNSDLGNWMRQRSRWIKGYMQTYLVHMKASFSFFRQKGIHALIFHLVIGGKLAFIIINPVLWILTLLYFVLYGVVGPTIDSLYPPFVLYVAITSLIFGNFLYLFCHIMGCVRNGYWGLIKYVYLIPLYWILISIAGFRALYQLVFKPFYWEKTIHGLHLKSIKSAMGTTASSAANASITGMN